MLGDNFINILSEEATNGYAHGEITEEFLKKHLDASINHIYICGPPPMVSHVIKQLAHMGVKRQAIIIEEMP